MHSQHSYKLGYTILSVIIKTYAVVLSQKNKPSRSLVIITIVAVQGSASVCAVSDACCGGGSVGGRGSLIGILKIGNSQAIAAVGRCVGSMVSN